MRFLWLSNAPWVPSGYGMQTREVLSVVNEDTPDTGIEGICLAYYGLEGSPIQYGNIYTLPNRGSHFGNENLPVDSHKLGIDYCFSLMDVFVLNPAIVSSVKWIPWIPIDTDPVSPKDLEVLHHAYKIITMSLFGKERLEDKGLKSTYIPHSIDTSIYKPVEDKEVIKQAILQDRYSPNSFIIGMVQQNKGTPSRKAFDYQFKAIREVMQNRPNVYLYLHSDLAGSEDLSANMNDVGIDSNRVIVSDPYDYRMGGYSIQDMATLYNGFDVLLQGVRGGGFEIPIIEALSCGVPVVTTNYTAMPTLIGDCGIAVEPANLIRYKESYQAIPDVEGMTTALLHYYENENVDRDKCRQQGLQFDTKRVYQERWKPLLQELEGELGGEAIYSPPVT